MGKARQQRTRTKKAKESRKPASTPPAPPAPAPEPEVFTPVPDAPAGTVRDAEGVRVLVRAGMRVEAEKNGDCFEQGIVESVGPSGALVRFEDGTVGGAPWDVVWVRAGGMDPGESVTAPNTAHDLYTDEMEGLRVRLPHSPVHLRAYLCQASWFRREPTLHVMLTPKQAAALGVAVVVNRGESYDDAPGAEDLPAAGYNLPDAATLPAAPCNRGGDVFYRLRMEVRAVWQRMQDAADAEAKRLNDIDFSTDAPKTKGEWEQARDGMFNMINLLQQLSDWRALDYGHVPEGGSVAHTEGGAA
jgi:hypothetical protein